MAKKLRDEKSHFEKSIENFQRTDRIVYLQTAVYREISVYSADARSFATADVLVTLKIVHAIKHTKSL